MCPHHALKASQGTIIQSLVPLFSPNADSLVPPRQLNLWILDGQQQAWTTWVSYFNFVALNGTWHLEINSKPQRTSLSSALRQVVPTLGKLGQGFRTKEHRERWQDAEAEASRRWVGPQKRRDRPISRGRLQGRSLKTGHFGPNKACRRKALHDFKSPTENELEKGRVLNWWGPFAVMMPPLHCQD